jgi:hypothetical protein
MLLFEMLELLPLQPKGLVIEASDPLSSPSLLQTSEELMYSASDPPSSDAFFERS